MDRQVYRDNISWEGLEGYMARNNVTYVDLGNYLGVNKTAIRNVIKVSKTCMVEMLVKLAAYFKCSVSDLVCFKDIEVKDRFREPYYRVHDPEGEVRITYAPMRDLFFGFYGDKWRSKLTEFFSQVELFDKTEGQKSAIEGNNSFKEAVKKRTEEGSNKRAGKNIVGGFNQVIRTKLRNDENVNLGTLYLICKSLGCTPDYIVDYK